MTDVLFVTSAFHGVLLWSAARALLIATLALPVAFLAGRLVSSTQRSPLSRTCMAIAVLVPLFVPDLLTGFTYRLTATRLTHSVSGTELLYAVLLLIRVTAMQVMILLILPDSVISRESRHCWKFVTPRNLTWRVRQVRLMVQGPWRTRVIAWIAGMLICFQDFETAALLQIKTNPVSWTVWLFDAQVAGEPLLTCLWYILQATLLQCVVLVPVLLWLRGSQNCGERTAFISESRRDEGRFVRGLAVGYVTAAILIILVWPIGAHMSAAISGLHNLTIQGSLWARTMLIVDSLLPSILVAVASLHIVLRLRATPTLVLLLPGLCGALFISLSLLALFQLPGLNLVYDTWIPMLIGQIFFVLPRAWVLVAVLKIVHVETVSHSAELLMRAPEVARAKTGRNLVWRLSCVQWLLAAALLTHLAFWDVTVVSTLRPVQFEPVVTRLYNEMHYGHTESLVAMTFLALVIPVIVLVSVATVWKRFLRTRLFSNG